MVALRKESVDRKPVVPAELTTLIKSLSARRAWIENVAFSLGAKADSVALRKESVDRKLLLCRQRLRLGGRSPQGERG